jgi:MFS family permease
MSVRLSPKALALVNLYIPSIFISFGQGMAVPVIPILALTFDVSPGLAAQVVTAHILGRTLSFIPSGILVDRVGRKPAMVIGPVMIAIGSLVTALTPYFIVLLAAQAVTGAGAGLWQMGRELTAVDLVKPDQRGRVMASFFGIGSVGMSLGPVIGGVLTDAIGFRAVFLAYMVMALAVLLVSLTIKETRQPSGPEKRPRFGLESIRAIEPYYRITFLVLIVATNAAILRSTSFNSMLPLYVGSELGFSTTTVGSLFGIMGVSTLVCLMPAGFVSDKIGRKAATGPSAALAAAVFVGLSFARSYPTLAGLAVFLGIANAFSMGSMTAFTYDIAPDSVKGQIQAIRRTSGEVGGIAGPLVGGVIANFSGAGRVFLFFAPVHALAAVLLLFVARESLVTKRRPGLAPPP